jgi:hypothetical protein
MSEWKRRTAFLTYCATGEGLTEGIIFHTGTVEDLCRFMADTWGVFMAQCCDIVDGFAVDDPRAKVLVSESILRSLSSPDGHKSLVVTYHANYS